MYEVSVKPVRSAVLPVVTFVRRSSYVAALVAVFQVRVGTSPPSRPVGPVTTGAVGAAAKR